MKRVRLTSRQCRKLLAKQFGCCAVRECEVVLVLGPRGQHTNFIDEHIIALGLPGGTNALKNRELRCNPHALEKTFGRKATTANSDIGKMKKLRHIRTGKMRVSKPPPGTREPKTIKRKWPSRPFARRKTVVFIRRRITFQGG